MLCTVLYIALFKLIIDILFISVYKEHPLSFVSVASCSISRTVGWRPSLPPCQMSLSVGKLTIWQLASSTARTLWDKQCNIHRELQRKRNKTIDAHASAWKENTWAANGSSLESTARQKQLELAVGGVLAHSKCR